MNIAIANIGMTDAQQMEANGLTVKENERMAYLLANEWNLPIDSRAETNTKANTPRNELIALQEKVERFTDGEMERVHTEYGQGEEIASPDYQEKMSLLHAVHREPTLKDTLQAVQFADMYVDAKCGLKTSLKPYTEPATEEFAVIISND